MILATNPPQPLKPPCRHCEATARACESKAWLAGRRCCERCRHVRLAPVGGSKVQEPTDATPPVSKKLSAAERGDS